jgi:hypothetical protein
MVVVEPGGHVGRSLAGLFLCGHESIIGAIYPVAQ